MELSSTYGRGLKVRPRNQKYWPRLVARKFYSKARKRRAQFLQRRAKGAYIFYKGAQKARKFLTKARKRRANFFQRRAKGAQIFSKGAHIFSKGAQKARKFYPKARKRRAHILKGAQGAQRRAHLANSQFSRQNDPGANQNRNEKSSSNSI